MTCYAPQIYSDVEHLREEVQSIMQGHQGRLSVGMIKGAVLLPTRAVTAVHLNQSELSVELIESTSSTLLGQQDPTCWR